MNRWRSLGVIILSFIVTFSAFSAGGKMAKGLTNDQQVIAEVASYAARGDQAGLKAALNKGLDQGITVNAFKEILVQVYAYCGFPRSLNALGTLMALEAERGNKDKLGPSSAVRPSADSLTTGAANQTKLTGRKVEGPLFTFAPAIDDFLKAHLFGDIFNRDTVDWQTRELATIAMLASREGVESQLQSHIQVGKHNGLSQEQVEAILVIAEHTGAENVLFGKAGVASGSLHQA